MPLSYPNNDKITSTSFLGIQKNSEKKGFKMTSSCALSKAYFVSNTGIDFLLPPKNSLTAASESVRLTIDLQYCSTHCFTKALLTKPFSSTNLKKLIFSYYFKIQNKFGKLVVFFKRRSTADLQTEYRKATFKLSVPQLRESLSLSRLSACLQLSSNSLLNHLKQLLLLPRYELRAGPQITLLWKLHYIQVFLSF